MRTKERMRKDDGGRKSVANILNTLRDALKRLVEYFKSMEKGRRNRLLILTSVALVLVIGASIFLTQTRYTVLYAGMRAEDAGTVMARLQEMGVAHKADGSDTILVDSSVADNVRMQLAAEGLPRSGFNFDIYANSSGLGATDQEKEVYYQWQMTEYIRESINALDKVQDCIVIVNFEENNPFVLRKNIKPATASVNLILRDGQELSDWEVRSVYNIVRGSVQGLELTNCQITDSQMRSYVIKDEEDPSLYVGDQLKLQQEVKSILEEQIEKILTPALGAGRFESSVNVKLNFDDTKSESWEYEPPVSGSEEGLAVSIRDFAEQVRGGTEGDVAGFDPNGAASQYQEYTVDENAVYSQISREVNYELNEVHTLVEVAKGSIRELSVSILLDSSPVADEGGEMVEPEDYSEIVRNLIVNAIGVNESRVSVERMPFREGVGDTSVAELLAMQEEMRKAARTAELIRLGIIVGTILIVLLLLFLIIRTLRKPREAVVAEGAGGEGLDLLVDDTLPTTDEALAQFVEQEDASLNAIEEYIDKSPEAVAQLLRNWLSEENRG